MVTWRRPGAAWQRSGSQSGRRKPAASVTARPLTPREGTGQGGRGTQGQKPNPNTRTPESSCSPLAQRRPASLSDHAGALVLAKKGRFGNFLKPKPATAASCSLGMGSGSARALPPRAASARCRRAYAELFVPAGTEGPQAAALPRSIRSDHGNPGSAPATRSASKSSRERRPRLLPPLHAPATSGLCAAPFSARTPSRPRQHREDQSGRRAAPGPQHRPLGWATSAGPAGAASPSSSRCFEKGGGRHVPLTARTRSDASLRPPRDPRSSPGGGWKEPGADALRRSSTALGRAPRRSKLPAGANCPPKPPRDWEG